MIKKTAPLLLALGTAMHAQADIIGRLDALALEDKPVALPRSYLVGGADAAIYFTPKTDVPMVQVSLLFHGGYAHGQPGLSDLAASMITEGTKRHSKEAFHKALENLGVRLDTHTSADYLQVHLTALNDEAILNEAVDLVLEAIRAPLLSDQARQMLIASNKTILDQSESDPDYLAQRAAMNALYGAHPYARSAQGTKADQDALMHADIQGFMARHLTAQNVKIVITGALDERQATRLGGRIWRGLKQGVAVNALPAPEPLRATKRIKVPHDTPQSAVVIARMAPSCLEQDIRGALLFELGNQAVAGGDFNSQLMQKVREEMGATYGIYGYDTKKRAGGHYQVSFATQSAMQETVIEATRDILEQTAQNGIHQDAFLLAKSGAQNAYGHRFLSTQNIHAQTLNLVGCDLPLNTFEIIPNLYASATLKETNAALMRLRGPYVIVTVGQD